MKKRLLSMLMAVLMIVSLVPGMALADTEYVIDIKADAAAKQPGIKVTEVKQGDVVVDYKVNITPFTKEAGWCDADKHVPVVKELIVAGCGKAGLTVTYCSVCGTDLKTKVVAEPLHHDCEFTVVEKPACTEPGWGYAVCKKCGEPFYIAASEDINLSELVEMRKGELENAYEQRLEAIAELYMPSTHDWKTVTADLKKINSQTGKEEIVAYAAKAATHVDMAADDAGKLGDLVYQWKNGGYISERARDFAELLAEGKIVKVDGNGYDAGVACTKCNEVQSMGGPSDSDTNLNFDHWEYTTVKDPGTYPKKFADGSYKDGKTATFFCSKCNKTFGGDVISAVKWFNIDTTAPVEYKIGDTKIYEGEDVYALQNGQLVAVSPEKLHKAAPATCCVEGNTGDIIVLTAAGEADKETGKVPTVWMFQKSGTVLKTLPHHYVIPKDVPATCNEKGKEYYKGVMVCDNVVGKTKDGKDIICYTQNNIVGEGFKLAKINDAVTEVNDEGIVTVKEYFKMTNSQHVGYAEKVLVEATCQHKGLNVFVCTGCGEYVTYKGETHFYTDKVKCVAADERANVVEATCTEAGYTGDVVCKWCGTVLEKGEEVPALGHKTEVKDAKAATCTEAGYTGDEVCTVCGETVKKGTEIPALGHKFENGVCTVCGAADPNYVVPNPFKDVEKTSPYYDAIIWAAKEEITTGKTADTFGIDEGCTRAQIVTFLYRAAGSPEVKADTVNPFTDVSKDSVYYNAILWAVEKGITKGTTETTFDPNAVCTRGQIVTFLFRASGDEKVATGTNFADVASGSYCADAVAWAVANKVANGFADGTFRPEATCTRGQAVTFIYRALAE